MTLFERPRAVVPAALWMAFIWGLSSTTWEAARAPAFLPAWLAADKIVHVVLFFVQSLLWTRAWPGRRPAHLVLAFAIAVLWGAVDEWHQAYVPGRTADGWDFAADALGAGLAVAWVELRHASQQRCA